MPSIIVRSLPPDARYPITRAAVQMLYSLGCNVSFRTAQRSRMAKRGLASVRPISLFPKPLPGRTFQFKTARCKQGCKIFKRYCTIPHLMWNCTGFLFVAPHKKMFLKRHKCCIQSPKMTEQQMLKSLKQKNRKLGYKIF